MNLTLAQLQAFKAAIQANGTASPLAVAGNFSGVAAYFNGASATSIWRNDVGVSEIIATVTGQVGVFAGLTPQKQTALLFLTQHDPVDATQDGVRQSFIDVFGAGSATVIALIAVAQRLATRFEAIAAFISVAAPANESSVVGAIISHEDVAHAMGS